MNKIKRLLLIMFSFIVLGGFLSVPSNISGWEVKDYVTYWGTTNEVFTAIWDPVPEAISYDYRIYHVEMGLYGTIKNTTATEVSIDFPKVGHYIFEVRSKNNSGTSAWAQSIDAMKAKVDGEQRAWWVYVCLEAPGIPVISHNKSPVIKLTASKFKIGGTN